MSSVLVCYGTGEGQTRKVARRIADGLAERGHVVEVVDADELPTDLAVSDFAAFVERELGETAGRDGADEESAAEARAVERPDDALAEPLQ